ncbi:MAG: response regulator [Sulfuritalea sp.]|nr:response regulator [Sulfuritalea sp.]
MHVERPLLLVEDNPDDEALTLRALSRNHIDRPVVTARDGVQALDWLFATGPHAGRDAGVQPALILMDLKLPRVDGLEVVRRIRADDRTRLLPVVVLTTSREQRDIRAAYAAGANGYVRKPVDFDKFTEALGLIGRYWLTLNEYPVDEMSRS